MTDSVTRYGRHKFGSDTAMPAIREVYAGVGGWKDFREAGLRLNRSTATELRAEGITMVRVKWRLKTIEISLIRYLDR